MLGHDIPPLMADIVPDAKILLVLRNPVDRFYSEYGPLRPLLPHTEPVVICVCVCAHVSSRLQL